MANFSYRVAIRRSHLSRPKQHSITCRPRYSFRGNRFGLPFSLQSLERIIAEIRSLATDPRPPRCKAMKGRRFQGHTRIRSGDYRIIYTIQDDVLLIVVVALGHRRDVYR